MVGKDERLTRSGLMWAKEAGERLRPDVDDGGTWKSVARELKRRGLMAEV